MGRQAQIFLDSEGAAWLKRNQDKLPIRGDAVLTAIKNLRIKPKTVLEVGCANGWRLKELYKLHKCDCHGIDPGITHMHQEDNITLYRGTADSLHLFSDGKFDLVIYGFCLYLCDPQDYFKIAMEGDRVLANGGYLVVRDFSTDFPHAVEYKHRAYVMSRKMNYSSMWMWNSAYTCEVSGVDEDMIATEILKKDMVKAFPVKR